MRVGLTLWGFSVGARAAVDLAVLAEQRGFDSVFMVEGVLSNDAVTTVAGMAGAYVSDRHRNGHRECLPASPCDAGHCRRHHRRPLGRTPRPRPGPEQRADDCPRGARVARSPRDLAGDDGDAARGVRGRSAARAAPPPPVAHAIPVHWAAMALETCEAAGAHADGLMLYLCSVDRYQRAVARMRRGAEAARRNPADVSVSLLIPTFVHDDLPIARQAAREFLVHYAGMPQYAKAFEASGFAGEMQGVRNGLATGRHGGRDVRALGSAAGRGPPRGTGRAVPRATRRLPGGRGGVGDAWPPAGRRAGPPPPGPARRERTGSELTLVPLRRAGAVPPRRAPRGRRTARWRARSGVRPTGGRRATKQRRRPCARRARRGAVRAAGRRSGDTRP